MSTGLMITIAETDKQSIEYRAAERFRDILKRDLPDKVLGHIILYPNMTVFGQLVKDIDLVVMGSIHNYSPKMEFNDNEGNPQFDEVYFHDFVTVIEIKGHDIRSILRKGPEIYVKYKDGNHSVTSQSEEQKRSLFKFFKSANAESPFITNQIWFENIAENDIKSLLTTEGGSVVSNLLPGDFDIKLFFQNILYQRPPIKRGNRYHSSSLGSNSNLSMVENLLNTFIVAKTTMGELTRKKVELIRQTTIDDYQVFKKEGSMSILRGRAGTGKTIGLIQAGLQINNEGYGKVLILTYNKALVSDIRRLLALSDVPDMFNPNSLSIDTIHGYYYNVLNKVFYNESLDPEFFLTNYEDLLKEAVQDLENELMDKEELFTILSNNPRIEWDYVLVDEAQDWTTKERDFLFYLFEKDRIIIADGGAQFVRDHKTCDWSVNDKRNIKLNQSLRQKSNLISFINKFTELYGLENPKIIGSKKMVGGRIIITTKDYLELADFHKKEIANLHEANNINYDMLFFVHPGMVVKIDGNNQFKYTKEFLRADIPIWDGSNPQVRSEYSINPSEFRLVQYDSARGLEAWTVVCLELDEFIKHKEGIYKPPRQESLLMLESDEDVKRRYIYNWIMIALTRAIDTIIITIKDPTSDIYQIFRKAAEELPDSVILMD